MNHGTICNASYCNWYLCTFYAQLRFFRVWATIIISLEKRQTFLVWGLGSYCIAVSSPAKPSYWGDIPDLRVRIVPTWVGQTLGPGRLGAWWVNETGDDNETARAKRWERGPRRETEKMATKRDTESDGEGSNPVGGGATPPPLAAAPVVCLLRSAGDFGGGAFVGSIFGYGTSVFFDYLVPYRSSRFSVAVWIFSAL
jgi:hypothetical protein